MIYVWTHSHENVWNDMWEAQNHVWRKRYSKMNFGLGFTLEYIMETSISAQEHPKHVKINFFDSKSLSRQNWFCFFIFYNWDKIDFKRALTKFYFRRTLEICDLRFFFLTKNMWFKLCNCNVEKLSALEVQVFYLSCFLLIYEC
jgi:hypothetical protein